MRAANAAAYKIVMADAAVTRVAARA